MSSSRAGAVTAAQTARPGEVGMAAAGCVAVHTTCGREEGSGGQHMASGNTGRSGRGGGDNEQAVELGQQERNIKGKQ